jgi:hypothetical protein
MQLGQSQETVWIDRSTTDVCQVLWPRGIKDTDASLLGGSMLPSNSSIRRASLWKGVVTPGRIDPLPEARRARRAFRLKGGGLRL